MKLTSVEFRESIRLPQVPGGRVITGLVARIDAGAEWLLDYDTTTGYVFVAPVVAPDTVEAFSPSIVRRVRFAPPESEKKATKGK